MYLFLLLAKLNSKNAAVSLSYSIKNKNPRYMYHKPFYMKVIFPHKINIKVKYWFRMDKFHICGSCMDHYRIYVKR